VFSQTRGIEKKRLPKVIPGQKNSVVVVLRIKAIAQATPFFCDAQELRLALMEMKDN
jgi:hypothetical protein